MLELLSLYNGTNNGNLFLSVRDATERLGFSDYRPAMAAFEELELAGLITPTFVGYFTIKAGEASRASTWCLNWIGDDGKRLAAEEMRILPDVLPKGARKRLDRRQSALKRYHKDRQAGKFAVVVSSTLEAERVVKSTTAHLDSVVESPTRSGKNA